MNEYHRGVILCAELGMVNGDALRFSDRKCIGFGSYSDVIILFVILLGAQFQLSKVYL